MTSSLHPLVPELRNKLERTIVEAREVAEAGAKAALEAIAVHHHETYGHMSPEERKLRNHLRARARQLGDKQNRKGELEIIHLACECAYEHWHRMLFARFLAENDLLIEPEMNVAISLEECEELAKEDGKDLWTLASEFAQRMLPQIFRTNDPVLKVSLAREHRIKLENLLNDLEPAIFSASDSLGWVYQFWQSKRKNEVNQSGNKIGADELPAVTQLFTEPYMVSFLLDNSLGAWWAGRRIKDEGGRMKDEWGKCRTEADCRSLLALPGVPLEYLRFVKQDNGAWAPATGTFDGWPEKLGELKVLDPCCGSGHFLVAAFLMLVPMRMKMEGLSARDACDAVLGENLHGLEIDNRCVELVAFTLALAAWGYPNAGGYRPLLELNLACSGLVISAKKEEWLAMADDNTNLRLSLEELYNQFKDATLLGSLINPEIGLSKGTIMEIKWKDLKPILTKAFSDEKDVLKTEISVVAQGIAKAADLLSQKYTWVITNVPYLTAKKQHPELAKYLEKHFPAGKADLSTSFLERCIGYCGKNGNASIVLPQNWLFLTSYKILREKLLRLYNWNLLVRLGEKAFESSAAAGAFTVLISMNKNKPLISQKIACIDAAEERAAEQKKGALHSASFSHVDQLEQLKNPDSRLTLTERKDSFTLLSSKAISMRGIVSGDTDKWVKKFWEVVDKNWRFLQSTPLKTIPFDGRQHVIDWSKSGKGMLRPGTTNEAYGKLGVALGQMRSLPATLYTGELYDNNTGVIVPNKKEHLMALWVYCSSPKYHDEVRKIDQKVNVTNATLIKVPFDFDHWNKIAKNKYPKGLPKPYSDDPTQWIFHGHPGHSEEALQIAVSKLLGYRWPAEIDLKMELSDEQRELVNKCNSLLKYVDQDGIVCIPSVRGEETADSRLRALLVTAFESEWSPSLEKDLIKAAGTNASNLDDWLRDDFFEQHCKLFHHRPFIWHIWDGRRRDGFHALVNYHKLAEGNGKGRQLLENLTYSYLNEWITRQKEGIKRGEGGAEDRLAAALELQKRLIAIIEGEPPFDIFVRWKPIEDQPIGWEPDINDGVRLNIRPFLAQDIPGGRKGAGILRWRPNINWNKDRGKDVASAPWFHLFKGDRINDHHLRLEEKRAARAKARGREGEKEKRGKGELEKWRRGETENG